MIVKVRLLYLASNSTSYNFAFDVSLFFGCRFSHCSCCLCFSTCWALRADSDYARHAHRLASAFRPQGPQQFSSAGHLRIALGRANGRCRCWGWGEAGRTKVQNRAVLTSEHLCALAWAATTKQVQPRLVPHASVSVSGFRPVTCRYGPHEALRVILPSRGVPKWEPKPKESQKKQYQKKQKQTIFRNSLQLCKLMKEFWNMYVGPLGSIWRRALLSVWIYNVYIRN